jgi:hypothetical protein
MTDSDGAGADPVPERDAVLAMLGDAVSEAHRKVESGRVRDADNEKVRQGWIRALAYCAGQYRQLKRDEELEEMAERLAELEKRAGVSSAGEPTTTAEAVGGPDS